jgi:molecular chaperone Hsp33
MPEGTLHGPGELRRFMLEEHPVRGHWVLLGEAWRELRSLQPYPPVVDELLGQAVTAAVLLAATLKFEGKLTLQLSGTGPVSLLVAQCTHDFRIRAVAQHAETLDPDSAFHTLVGSGRLVVTIEATERGTRYQGIVPLEGASMSSCLETYFATSEQLPTRLCLASDAEHAGGLLIQKLPAAGGEAAGAVTQEAWEQLTHGLDELAPAGLLETPIDTLLPQLCGPFDSRLFAASQVQFECGCSRERVAAVLRSLGKAEVDSVLAEQGSVTVTCEFCRRPYRFDAVDAVSLFADASLAEPPASIN